MRSLPLLFMVLLTACGGGLGPLYAEVRWALRCEAMGGCVGSSSHDVVGNAGEGGIALRCDVVESATSRTVSLSVTENDGDGFAIDAAQVPLTGGPAGGAGCRSTVSEGVNRYGGACGSAAPSTAQPCQVNNIMFYRDTMGIPWVEGDMFCVDLPQLANPSVVREVTISGEGPGVSTTPAHFSMANCRGLTVM